MRILDDIFAVPNKDFAVADLLMVAARKKY